MQRYRTTTLKRLFFFSCAILFGTMLLAQPGGPPPGGRPSGPPPGFRPGQGPGGFRPDMNQSQNIKQKKKVNDSTLLTVVGTLVDSTTNEALMYVTVGIMKQSDSTLVKGAFTTEKGEFEAKGIIPGSY